MVSRTAEFLMKVMFIWKPRNSKMWLKRTCHRSEIAWIYKQSWGRITAWQGCPDPIGPLVQKREESLCKAFTWLLPCFKARKNWLSWPSSPDWLRSVSTSFMRVTLTEGALAKSRISPAFSCADRTVATASWWCKAKGLDEVLLFVRNYMLVYRTHSGCKADVWGKDWKWNFWHTLERLKTFRSVYVVYWLNGPKFLWIHSPSVWIPTLQSEVRWEALEFAHKT